MVGVVNPNATTSLQNQKQLAKDSSFMLTPGQPWPDEAEDPFTTTAGSTPTATSTPSNPTANATGVSTSASTSSHHSSLSTGAIAGIAIGATAVALAAAALLYICGRQSRRHTAINQQEDRPGTGHATMHSMAYNPHGQYVDPMKHMSMHSSVMPLSPALPGYAPTYDPNMSPALHSAYPMSDSLKPGMVSEIATLHSTSPSPLYSTPAYPNGPHNM